jgi:hypothetical protein
MCINCFCTIAVFENAEYRQFSLSCMQNSAVPHWCTLQWSPVDYVTFRARFRRYRWSSLLDEMWADPLTSLLRLHLLHSVRKTCNLFFILWRFDPIPGHGLPIWGLAMTLIGRTTLGRAPLDKWSVRRQIPLPDNTHNRYPRCRRDSNPQSQQASGRRPTR